MATETDLWQTAWIIAEQYGAKGVDLAAEMARSFKVGGKIDADKAWTSIMKIETLTAAESSNGAAA
jgi:hypothetical protein